MTATEQIPLTATDLAGHAWKSLRSAVQSMTLLFVGALILDLVVEAFFSYKWLWLPAGLPRTNTALLLGSILGKTILQAIITAPAAVAMHRFILLGEITPGMISLRPSYSRLFLAWVLGLGLLGAAAGTIGTILSDARILKWIVIIIEFVVAIRLILIFPAVATGVASMGWKERVKISLQLTEGRFWLLVRTLILSAIPIVAYSLVLTTILIFISVSEDGPYMGQFQVIYPVVEVLSEIGSFVSLMLGAAIASWLYAVVTHPAAPIDRP